MMNDEPNSKLTAERPDIWVRAIELATSVTGREYVHKAPLPDGAIYACGGGGGLSYRPPPPTPHEIKIRQIKELDYRIRKNEESYWRKPGATIMDYDAYVRNIKNLEKKREEARKLDIPTPELDKTIAEYEIGLPEQQRKNRDSVQRQVEELDEELKKLKQQRSGITLAPIAVPDGAMEWLLHEVGHWTAATPEERILQDYGYGVVKKKGWGIAREWQAWAFEEIIMAPFGPSRGFAPPEHRGGTAFDGPGHQLIPERHLKHADVRIVVSGVDVEQWRALYGEWVRWGNCNGIYSTLNH